MARPSTAVAAFRVDPVRSAEVLRWQAEIDAAAAKWPGFVESQLTPGDESGGDWGAAVTFGSERQLRAWLASDERAQLATRAGELGVVDAAPPIIMVEGERPPPGVAVFAQHLAPGQDAAFIDAQHRLVDACKAFPGYLGSLLIRPGAVRGMWLSVMRFATDAQLQAWLGSPERARLLPGLRGALDEDFEEFTSHAPFGSIIRREGSETKVTPNWKIAMVVLMVLYPTVMLLTRFVQPLLVDTGIDVGGAIFFSLIISTVALTWLLTPLAMTVFRRWLDPIEGAGPRRAVSGAAVIIAIYVIEIALFQLVRPLQFWN